MSRPNRKPKAGAYPIPMGASGVALCFSTASMRTALSIPHCQSSAMPLIAHEYGTYRHRAAVINIYSREDYVSNMFFFV